MLKAFMRPAGRGWWLAPVVVVLLVLAHPALTTEPQRSTELIGFEEVTDVWVENAAVDSCWPQPEVTKNFVVARLKAAGLYKGTPLPKSTTGKREWWYSRMVHIHVHAYDVGLEVNGDPVPFCVAYVKIRLLNSQDRRHLVRGYLKGDGQKVIQDSALELTDQLIADWVESNK